MFLLLFIIFTALFGAKRPCLPWKGVAERSESFKIMIAGGNHTAVKRWLSVSETGGVCASTARVNPSVSPFGLPAPLSGVPRRVPFNRVLSKIRGFGRMLSAPTVAYVKPGAYSFNVAHPLSFAFAQQLPQRGGAEGASRHGSAYSSTPTMGMYHSMGNVTWMVVPTPGRLETSMAALWSIAACLTMDSPRPVPPTSLEWLLSTR